MAAATTRRVAGAGGVEIAAHRLGGEGPPVMIVHATGFHGRCYTRLAQSLLSEFSVWAIDQRGHGESGKAPDDRYDDWSVFAEDLLRVIDALEPAGQWRAAGHSLGGAVALLAEALRPGAFSALCCYEPVVFPDNWLPATGEPAHENAPARPAPLALLARKRRPSFPSTQAAFDNYRSKPPFASFDAQALHDYVDYGLVDAGDGTVTLACRREDEAAVFESAAANGAWDRLPDVRPPVAILAGSNGSDPVSAIASEVARRLPRGGYRQFGHLDHFGPMTAPDEVGGVVATALRAAAPGAAAPGAGAPGAAAPEQLSRG